MDFRSQVKQILRMCGHALVRTVHERLDALDKATNVLVEQNNRLARNQTALLQSGIHIVESLHQMEHELETQAESHRKLLQLVQVQGVTPESLVARCRDVGMQQVHTDVLLREGARQVCVETSDYAATNPEIGLMEFLSSHLPGRKALDIGANTGMVSECLLNAGYEVHAIEPYPASYEHLVRRLDGNPRFHSYNIALGSQEDRLPMHLASDLSKDSKYGDPSVFHSLVQHSMPEDLPFRETTMVPVKALSDLHRARTIPEDISLVKIDTEGYDLEVVRGMGEYRYPVVSVEYWDKRIPFGTSGLLYTFKDMVEAMRGRGYDWHIVLYRVWGRRDQIGYHCNHDRPVPESWGNIYFFRGREIFTAAREWCAAVLPQTYFKAVPAAQGQSVSQ